MVVSILHLRRKFRYGGHGTNFLTAAAATAAAAAAAAAAARTPFKINAARSDPSRKNFSDVLYVFGPLKILSIFGDFRSIFGDFWLLCLIKH